MSVTLAEMCIIARKKNKMTQAEFAKLIGSNQAEISYIEHGYIPRRGNKAQAIRRHYQECMGGGHKRRYKCRQAEKAAFWGASTAVSPLVTTG